MGCLAEFPLFLLIIFIINNPNITETDSAKLLGVVIGTNLKRKKTIDKPNYPHSQNIQGVHIFLTDFKIKLQTAKDKSILFFVDSSHISVVLIESNNIDISDQ